MSKRVRLCPGSAGGLPPVLLLLLAVLLGMAGVHSGNGSAAQGGVWLADPDARLLAGEPRARAVSSRPVAEEYSPEHPSPACVSDPDASHSLAECAVVLPGATESWTPWWGVQVYPGTLDLDRILESQAGWLRLPLDWSGIEPSNTTPDAFRWSSALDALLAQLSSQNVRVILTVQNNPSWAATLPGGPIDLVPMAEMVEFVQAAVARYGAPPYNVKHWEIYNEPDNYWEARTVMGGFGCFGHQPEAYADILAALYGPIKQVDPDAQVVLGGIVYDNWSQGFAPEFLDGVLQHGGGAHLDVVNFHYYPAFAAAWESYGGDILGKTHYLRDKLASYGVYKPLICTETFLGSAPGFNGGDDELQSRYVVQVFVRSRAAGLSFTIWWGLFDSYFSSLRPGLFDLDLNPKPSLLAYQTLARELSGMHYGRTLGPAETGSEQIEAYDFAETGGGERLIVAWTRDGQSYPLSVETQLLTVVEKFGSKVTLRDGDDGEVDGHVEVVVGPSPLYLRFEAWHSLTVGTIGQGTVRLEPDAASHLHGAQVLLTPLPDPGWRFNGWTGPHGADVVDNGDGTWRLVMDEDKALTARFFDEQNYLTLRIHAFGNGTVVDTPGNPYTHGEWATLQPRPAPRWHLAQWIGQDAARLEDNGDGTWSLLMDADRSIGALFAEDRYTVQVEIEGRGSVDHWPGNPYAYGDEAVLRPLPAEGWTFAGWRGPDAAALVQREDGAWALVVDADKSVTARFFSRVFLPMVGRASP
jgi:hypothetical protein